MDVPLEIRKNSTSLHKMNENSLESTKEHFPETDQESSADGDQLHTTWELEDHGNSSCILETNSVRVPTFNSLALDVSYAGIDSSGFLNLESSRKSHEENSPKLWEDFSVVEYLEKKLSSTDDSTPEERVEALKEVLEETDIHEGDGILSDFLFYIAKTKHGKIYIKVIRTMLANRGTHIDPQLGRSSFSLFISY